MRASSSTGCGLPRSAPPAHLLTSTTLDHATPPTTRPTSPSSSAPPKARLHPERHAAPSGHSPGRRPHAAVARDCRPPPPRAARCACRPAGVQMGDEGMQTSFIRMQRDQAAGETAYRSANPNTALQTTAETAPRPHLAPAAGPLVICASGGGRPQPASQPGRNATTAAACCRRCRLGGPCGGRGRPGGGP